MLYPILKLGCWALPNTSLFLDNTNKLLLFLLGGIMVCHYVKKVCLWFLGMYTKENTSEVLWYLIFSLTYFCKKKKEIHKANMAKS